MGTPTWQDWQQLPPAVPHHSESGKLFAGVGGRVVNNKKRIFFGLYSKNKPICRRYVEAFCLWSQCSMSKGDFGG